MVSNDDRETLILTLQFLGMVGSYVLALAGITLTAHYDNPWYIMLTVPCLSIITHCVMSTPRNDNKW